MRAASDRVNTVILFVVTSILILDDKLAPNDGASANCIDGTTIQFVLESSSCVRQDERNQAQLEDDGRSGGPRDSAGGNKGSNRVLLWHDMCSYEIHNITF